jgi:hypothetical protein
MRALRPSPHYPNRREDAGPFQSLDGRMFGKGGRLTAMLDEKGVAYDKTQLLA